MNIFKKNNEKKTTQKLPMTGKVRKGFRAYCAVIAAATLVCLPPQRWQCWQARLWALCTPLWLLPTCASL